MYGLLIENALAYMRSTFREKVFKDVIESARLKIDSENVDVFRVYPEGNVSKLVKKASRITQMDESDILEVEGVLHGIFLTFLIIGNRCLFCWLDGQAGLPGGAAQGGPTLQGVHLQPGQLPRLLQAELSHDEGAVIFRRRGA